jgi:hypothetical protein
MAAYERIGEKPEGQETPIFKSKRINRSIIIKHALRGAEVDLFDSKKVTGTKIVFPLAMSDLSLGGSFCFVGQKNANQSLREMVGDGVAEKDFQEDLKTLELFDQLPSLDPFLLREGLRLNGIEPSRCYFDISEADIERMTRYVSKEIAALVRLAFAGGGADTDALCQTMAEKLLSDENAERLAPLRETLQLSGNQYSESIFAWKGFLYYKWVYGDAQLMIARVIKEMGKIKVLRCEFHSEAHIYQSRDRVVKQLSVLQSFVMDALGNYDTSFRDLTVHARPAAFREFLLSSPAMFMGIGRKLGALMHVASYWRFRFGERPSFLIEAQDAVDLFENFELNLETGGAAAQSQRAWN